MALCRAVSAVLWSLKSQLTLALQLLRSPPINKLNKLLIHCSCTSTRWLQHFSAIPASTYRFSKLTEEEIKVTWRPSREEENYTRCRHCHATQTIISAVITARPSHLRSISGSALPVSSRRKYEKMHLWDKGSSSATCRRDSIVPCEQLKLIRLE